MRVFLNNGLDRLQIVSASHLRRFHDLAAARVFLRPLLDDPVNRQALREAFAEARPSARADDHALVDEIARRLLHDDLVLVSCVSPVERYGLEVQVAPQAVQATTPLEDEQAAKKTPEKAEEHWLEIELLDDQGQPVAGELYTVELPDGSVISGRLDALGQARHEGIDPGTAKVSFPNLDKKLYEPE